MKSGICPKCESTRNLRRFECIRTELKLIKWRLRRMNTILLVCADCGYLEFYVENEKDLEKIKKKFRKVEN